MMVAQKEALEKMYQLCELVENTGGVKDKLDLGDEVGFDVILKLNLLCFLAYLAASDGVIFWNRRC